LTGSILSLTIVRMSNIDWRDFYNAALQESDWMKVEERIQTAESEIHKRWIALSQGADGTLVEVDALASALNRLKVVRTDIAAWLERQSEPRQA
jgi:hypothetical protein